MNNGAEAILVVRSILQLPEPYRDPARGSGLPNISGAGATVRLTKNPDAC